MALNSSSRMCFFIIFLLISFLSWFITSSFTTSHSRWCYLSKRFSYQGHMQDQHFPFFFPPQYEILPVMPTRSLGALAVQSIRTFNLKLLSWEGQRPGGGAWFFVVRKSVTTNMFSLCAINLKVKKNKNIACHCTLSHYQRSFTEQSWSINFSDQGQFFQSFASDKSVYSVFVAKAPLLSQPHRLF